MSGEIIEIEGTPLRTIERAINSLLSRGSMMKYARRVRANTRRRMRSEVSPLDTPWAALSEPYASSKKGPGILRETLEMFNTIEVSARKGEAEVGTDLERGIFHQFGTSRMPAREWLGVTDDDLSDVELVAETVWEGAFDGA